MVEKVRKEERVKKEREPVNDVKSITNQLRKIHYAYIVPTLNTHKYGTRYRAIENNNVCKYGKCIESIFFSNLRTYKLTCKYIAGNFSPRF